MKTKKFPERVEKFGVSATIYAPNDEAKGFTVAYHVKGKLVRNARNSHEDAKQLGQSVVKQQKRPGGDPASLWSQNLWG